MDSQIVHVVGRLGKDPERKFSKDGNTEFVTFSVAASHQRNASDTGNTTWYQITAFGKLATTCETFLHKGSKVYIVADIGEVRGYNNKDGTIGVTVDCVLASMLMLDTRPTDGEAPRYKSNGHSAQPSESELAAADVQPIGFD